MHVSHQRIETVANQGSIMNNISPENDEEEEESQHHVTKVTEDVVERTARDIR